jgi:hypothetical protein
VKILGIDPVVTRGMLDEIDSALFGETLVGGCAKPIEPPEEEFEGEQQDKDDRYGNSNLKHGKALLRVRHLRLGVGRWDCCNATVWGDASQSRPKAAPPNDGSP